MQNAFNLKYASNQAEIKTAFDAMSEPMRQEQTAFGINLVTSLLSGNAPAAVTMLKERIAAAENSGNTEEAAKLRANLKIIEMDPYAAAISIGSAMTAADAIKPDVWKSILDSTQPKTPEGFQSLQLRAEAAGFVPGTDEYKQFMASGGDKGPLVTNILGDAESTFAKELAKGDATRIMATIDAGQSASRNLVELDSLSDLLGKVDTGGSAAAKEWLGTFGISTEGLDDIQAFQAVIARMIPAQREQGAGSSSNLDVQQFAKGLPALIKQPGGNQIIIETLRDINEYDVAASIIAGQVAEWAQTPAADRKALEAQGLILSPANGRKAIMDLGSPTAAYKASLKQKPPATTTTPAPTDAKATFLADPRIKALDPAQQETAWTKYQEIMAGQ
jgi:hypothetical protein